MTLPLAARVGALAGVGHFFENGFDAFDEVDHAVMADHVIVDADAFPHVDEVGGGVESRFKAACPKHACEHVAGGAFALGAGDMGGLEARVGVAQVLQEGAHAVERKGRGVVADHAHFFVVGVRHEEVHGAGIGGV